MAFSETTKQRLAAELNRDRVKKRKVDGRTEVEYLETHDCFREANDTFGVDGWTTKVHEIRLVDGPREITKKDFAKKDKDNRPKEYKVWYVAYLARGEVITAAGGSHEDVAVGEAYTRQPNPPNHDMAAKAAVSGMKKRCLRAFSPGLGLLLPDDDDPYGEKYAAHLRSEQQAPATSAPADEPEHPATGASPPEPDHAPSPGAGVQWPDGQDRSSVERHLLTQVKGHWKQHKRLPRCATSYGSAGDIKALDDKPLLELALAVEAELAGQQEAA